MVAVFSEARQEAGIRGERRRGRRVALLVAVLAPLAIAAVTTLAILRACDGQFFYTLDDPYIHLALAENILRGHYGINLDEPSSPSSSIVYPFLVAAAMLAGIRDLGPLWINLAALAGASALIWLILQRHVLSARQGSAWEATAIAVVIAVALNLVGVAFGGLEHGLHVLLTVAVVLGLLDCAESGRPPRWLWAALVLEPLVRFEGGAILLAGAWFLWTQGHRRLAIHSCACAGALGLLYAAGMLALGLPILPSSVLAKTYSVEINLLLAMLQFGALPALVGLVFFAYRLWRVEGCSFAAPSALVQAAMLPIMLHFAAGRFGTLGRYETYLNVYMVLMAAYTLRAPLRRVLDRRLGLVLVAAALLTVFLRQGPGNLYWTAQAANNVYEQQYQMHRFATEFYPDPVAVNDLGYVSYRNDRHVLDLWGLGNETARRLRKARAEGWMAPLAAEHGATLAMIYERWFGAQIPPTWRRVARMSLGGPRISPAEDTVAFYATTDAACAPLLERLAAFGPTLPPGVWLDIDATACR